MKKSSGLDCPEKEKELGPLDLQGLRMYNAREVGKMLRVHERSITGWANAGKIGHYCLEGRKVFAQADIEEYLKSKHRPATPLQKIGDAQTGLLETDGKEGK